MKEKENNHYLCRPCFDLLLLTTRRCPLPTSNSVPPEASSSSLAAFPPNHPPASHQPDTPPLEPGLICCWMKQLACWRIEAVTDHGDGFWRCLSLEWRCGTPPGQRQMTQEPPWHFRDPSWGSSCHPCLGELPSDSVLLVNCV